MNISKYFVKESELTDSKKSTEESLFNGDIYPNNEELLDGENNNKN